jgi:hypothetical protein
MKWRVEMFMDKTSVRQQQTREQPSQDSPPAHPPIVREQRLLPNPQVLR